MMVDTFEIAAIDKDKFATELARIRARYLYNLGLCKIALFTQNSHLITKLSIVGTSVMFL